MLVPCFSGLNPYCAEASHFAIICIPEHTRRRLRHVVKPNIPKEDALKKEAEVESKTAKEKEDEKIDEEEDKRDEESEDVMKVFTHKVITSRRHINIETNLVVKRHISCLSSVQ